MLLSETNIPQKKLNILAKRGIFTTEQLLYSAPKRYYFFDKTYPLSIEATEQIRTDKIPAAFVGTLVYVDSVFKNGKSIIKMRVKDEHTEAMLFVNIIGMYSMLKYYASMIDKRVIVGGILQYSDEYKSFSMLNPVLLSCAVRENTKIIPVYSKYKGISAEYYEEMVADTIASESELDYIPSGVIDSCHLLKRKDAIKALHCPSNADDIKKAQKRIVFDDMIYFTCKLEEQSKNSCSNSSYIVNKTDKMQELINSLPFTLTNGQQSAIDGMCEKARRGERISALVQGDVGSGKTIVAVSTMTAMAENGYQSVLMVFSAVLAEQHYQEICKRTQSMGFKTALLLGGSKAVSRLSDVEGTVSRKKVLEQIVEGKVDFIVGTQSCISESVVYKNLGLTIADEEHKFGVLQRETLLEKSSNGVHNIIMSGTPIPRTLATTFYGNHTDVYSMELPANRKPIQTAVCTQDKPIFEWVLKEIQKGRQCYVVCPLIEAGEDGSLMEGIASVEETTKKYTDYFTPFGIKTCMITGKTPKEEQSEIMRAFKNNEAQILLATTVIEVGVDNPNASVMVITGAERFGLATLHQLRGRVGRGEYQSYCILQKSITAKDSVNLDVLCKNANGLDIARADLANRGSGNIIGVEQSGANKYIDLMLSYPNMYEAVKKIAKKLCETNTGKDIIRIYEEYYPQEVV